MTTRITADIDSRNKLNLVYCISKAIHYIKRIKKLEIRRSSKRGYHIIVWTEINYTKEQIYKIRKVVGDDLNRIRNDRKRKIGYQTLFNKKIRVKTRLR